MKKQTIRERLLASTMICSAALMAFAAAPAFAQDAAEEEAESAEIVVTGSRIVRSDVTAASPLTVVTGEELQQSGQISISEVLRKDPAVSAGGFGQSSILSGGGASTIDLRNLGTNRTLVMVNAKRYSLFTDSLQNQSQDLGFLPIGMIERVEILRDGASAAYGADAVAGVVNFIIRDSYEGLQLNALAGVSDDGDGAQYRISGLWGASSDRGNVVMGLEFQHRDQIRQADRDWATSPVQAIGGSTFTINSGLAPGGQIVDRNPATGTAASLLACFPNAGGPSLGAGVPANCPRYDFSADQTLVGARDVYSMALHADYDLGMGIELTADVIYGVREDDFNLSANPMSANSPTGPYVSGINVLASSSTNPYGQDVSITWRPTRYGIRNQYVDASQLWASVGLNGKVFDRYNWEVNHTWSKTNGNQQTENVFNVVRLSRVLNPAQCAADPVCSSPTVGPISNINDLLSQTTPLTEGQRNYIFYTSQTTTQFESRQTVGQISGPLFALPAGDLQFAFGLEYRQETGANTPDAMTSSGESIANATEPTRGAFESKEAFLEIEVPLLADMPLFQDLTLNMQGRLVDYSNFGNADVYKIGLNWKVNDDLRIRSAVGTSFRVPDVVELYGGAVQTFAFITDPCNSGPSRVVGSNRDINCTNAGAPNPYAQPAAQLRAESGGNPFLQPETGESFTLGAVITPTLLPGFRSTIDYYQFRVDGAVGSQSLTTVLNNCYDLAPAAFAAAAADPTNLCYQKDLRASGNLTTLVNIQENLNYIETSGVDFMVGYKFDAIPFLPGSLDLELRGSWVESYDSNGSEIVGGITTGGTVFAVPEWKATLDAEWRFMDFSALWSTQFISGMDDFRAGGASIAVPNVLNYYGPDSYYLHDLAVRWSHENVGLTFGVSNVFDEDPPFVLNTGNNTAPGLYDVVGRYFFLSSTVKF
ncbi:MAG TPA: TonB-dependent receptor [Caulobacteraceae bacterium]|nr:TonB-dependent receptor [Caulobacteraceae bacterium]